MQLSVKEYPHERVKKAYMQRNLIWIIVDSVRTFKTGADDRDRLDFMDEFGQESVEFLKAFASAPSSILSGAAMFTGMPACFISRHFSDWQFDPEYILSIQDVLEQNGYTIYAIHNSKEDRQVMRDLIKPIPHKYFPKGVSHAEWWTNHQVNQILENVLRKGFQQPAFFMLWYDCRRDPFVSDRVKAGVQLFKQHGLYEDCIVILTSDHGYPDPRSGLTESTMRNTRHDMVVTDDNIQVPLLIKCPGFRSRKVKEMIGLIDLLPTTLKLLNVEIADPRLQYVQGRDLTPLMEGKKAPWVDGRVIRVDTRLTLAPGRVTALRTNNYKYVYYHDENAESLFYLVDDPLELQDLLDGHSTSEIEELRYHFRKNFKKLQEELNQFHKNELIVAFHKNVARLKKRLSIDRMLFLSTAPDKFLNLTATSFRETFPDITIDWLVSENYPISENVTRNFDHIFRFQKITPETARIALGAKKLTRYDLVLLITEQSSIGFDDPVAYKVAKMVGRKVLLIDFNMRFYSRFIARWLTPVLKYARNWVFYKQEPVLIIKDMVKLITRGVNILILKKTGDTPDMEKSKKMRDRALLAQKEVFAVQCETDYDSDQIAKHKLRDHVEQSNGPD